MKNKTAILLLFPILVSALASFPAGAAPAQMITDEKTYSVQAEEGAYEKEDLFNEKVITDDGTYLLQDISYYIKDQAPVLADTFYTKTVTETTDNQSYRPKKYIQEDGIEYELVETSASDTVLDQGYDQAVSEIRYYLSEEAVPDFITVQETDLTSGEVKDVRCLLSALQEDGGSWKEETIPVTYHNYGADYYVFAGYEVPHREEKPALSGYEDAILLDAGYDPADWEITDINWSGEPYQADGEICRNAAASVRTWEVRYRAEFEGSIHSEPVVGKIYTCFYEGKKTEAFSGLYDYEICATAVYRLEEAESSGFSVPIKLIVGIGVVVLAVGFAVDIFLATVANKRRRDD